MTRYWIAIHHPDDFDSTAPENQATQPGIEALNREMRAKGVIVFIGGLQPAGSARSVRPQAGGKVLVTDGPYVETKEHVGGFWVIEAADMDEAMAWGQKAAVACRAPVEVRPFH